MKRKARVVWVGLTPKQMKDTADLLILYAVFSPNTPKRTRHRALALSLSFDAAYRKAMT